jgi:type IV secretory pathway TrbD component
MKFNRNFDNLFMENHLMSPSRERVFVEGISASLLIVRCLVFVGGGGVCAGVAVWALSHSPVFAYQIFGQHGDVAFLGFGNKK